MHEIVCSDARGRNPIGISLNASLAALFAPLGPGPRQPHHPLRTGTRNRREEWPRRTAPRRQLMVRSLLAYQSRPLLLLQHGAHLPFCRSQGIQLRTSITQKQQPTIYMFTYFASIENSTRTPSCSEFIHDDAVLAMNHQVITENCMHRQRNEPMEIKQHRKGNEHHSCCALKELVSLFMRMGDNSDQLSQNPPVYIANSRNWNTPFTWYDGQQLDCNNTPYKYFALAADQTLQLP